MLKKQGFLSPDIEEWRERLRKDSAPWFAKIAEVNDVAQRFAFETVLETKGKPADRLLLSMQLFVRALSNFQGAILLVERGMLIEARTLTRACLETMFFLGATLNPNFDVINVMLHDDFSHKQKLARELDSFPEFREQAHEELIKRVDHIKAQPAPTDSPEKINYQILAKKADMPHLYSIYRQLCGDAAHTTMSSLGGYIQADEDGKITTVRFGPNDDKDEFSWTVHLACNVMLGACVAFNQIAENQHLNGVLTSIFEEFPLPD